VWLGEEGLEAVVGVAGGGGIRSLTFTGICSRELTAHVDYSLQVLNNVNKIWPQLPFDCSGRKVCE
jgi:hypothetical protein